MELYGDYVQVCPGTTQYIWNDQICDSRNDCPFQTDEINCKTCKFGLNFLNVEFLNL